jgi:hypothetical protein
MADLSAIDLTEGQPSAIAGNTGQVMTINALAAVVATAAAQAAIEAKIDASNTKLDAISANTLGTPTKLDAIGEKLDAATLQSTRIVITPTISTAALTSGQLLFDVTTLTNAVRENGTRGIIQTINIIDEANQGISFDLFINQTNTTWGSLAAAPSISFANLLAAHPEYYPVLASHFTPVSTTAKIATINNVNWAFEAAAGTRDVYMTALTRGTPDYVNADDLTLEFIITWF